MRKLMALAGLVASAAVPGVGCSASDDSKAGNPTDRAFAEAMVPHHQMAVDMAEIAEQRARHREVRQLAADIKAAQTHEIAALRQLGRKLKHHVQAGELALPDHLTGMDADMRMLARARPFDRAFLSMMVPHHQGAIRMARVELRKGQQPRLRALAREIVSGQQREIEQMRSWSKRWYGTPPSDNEHMDSDPSHMNHKEGYR